MKVQEEIIGMQKEISRFLKYEDYVSQPVPSRTWFMQVMCGESKWESGLKKTICPAFLLAGHGLGHTTCPGLSFLPYSLCFQGSLHPYIETILSLI